MRGQFQLSAKQCTETLYVNWKLPLTELQLETAQLLSLVVV